MPGNPRHAATGHAPPYGVVLGLLVLVGAAVVITWYYRGVESPHAVGATPSEAHRATAKTGLPGIQWYDHHARYWQGLEYVPLDDRAALRETVAGWIAERHFGADINPEPLIRDLTTFLYAQSSPDPSTYLERIAEQRRLRSDLRNDDKVQGRYRTLTGAHIAADASAFDVLARFWQSAPNAAGRPRAVATKAVVQVLPADPLPPGGLPAGWLLFNATHPQFTVWEDLGETEMDRWMGPFASGAPQITAPTTPYADVYDDHEQALICTVHTAVKTTEGAAFVIALDLYFAPAEDAWHVQWFVNYYPYAVWWPF